MAAGADVRKSDASFVYTHQKTILVDGRALVVFSGNFDRRSFSRGRNYAAIARDPEDLWDVADRFSADWDGQPISTACTRLVIAPTNATERLVALLDSAKTDLIVEALYASDRKIVEAIVRAKTRGVSVRVLVNDPRFGVGDATETAATFEASGITVRRSDARFLHAKVIVVDTARVFIGSENFSRNSLTKNREVGLVFSQTDLPVSEVVAVFEGDFADGKPFDFAANRVVAPAYDSMAARYNSLSNIYIVLRCLRGHVLRASEGYP